VTQLQDSTDSSTLSLSTLVHEHHWRQVARVLALARAPWTRYDAAGCGASWRRGAPLKRMVQLPVRLRGDLAVARAIQRRLTRACRCAARVNSAGLRMLLGMHQMTPHAARSQLPTDHELEAFLRLQAPPATT
jgi:hypothetical protein